jgi:hypothetical protein
LYGECFWCNKYYCSYKLRYLESYKYISGDSISLSSSSTPSIDCNGLLGGDWLSVTGNPTLGTNNFCVMKFEAKDNSGTASSVPTDTPCVSINEINARIACSNLGTGYKLITDPKWVYVLELQKMIILIGIYLLLELVECSIVMLIYLVF